MSESHDQRFRSFGERMDDLEKQVWKVRWGLYVLAVAVASPKVGGPDVGELTAVVIGLVV